MKKEFYSNGKLLISGEYVVLDGAQALALPTKFGQSLHIESKSTSDIFWTSKDADGSIWFQDDISFKEIINRTEHNNPITNTLLNILHEGYLMMQEKENFLSTGYNVTTELNFPRNWGLGTSSTLINNIANWLEIDAFQLLQNSFGGSGYDIACAQHDSPILYQIKDNAPKIIEIPFHPSWSSKLYFVYLNRKQNSKSAITKYRERKFDLGQVIENINSLTEIISTTKNQNEFIEALEKHEMAISEILEIPTVKSDYFTDFSGTVKSLGAWGGDFVMAYSKENPSTYFKSKGYSTILTYEEMIK